MSNKGHKPNKIWVDKGSKFYNWSIESWLEKTNIEMYSTHNEEKSVITERLFRTLKNNIYKQMTIHIIDKLNDMVNKWNNTYYNKIKMKCVHVKASTYFESSQENNN